MASGNLTHALNNRLGVAFKGNILLLLKWTLIIYDHNKLQRPKIDTYLMSSQKP